MRASQAAWLIEVHSVNDVQDDDRLPNSCPFQKSSKRNQIHLSIKPRMGQSLPQHRPSWTKNDLKRCSLVYPFIMIITIESQPATMASQCILTPFGISRSQCVRPVDSDPRRSLDLRQEAKCTCRAQMLRVSKGGLGLPQASRFPTSHVLPVLYGSEAINDQQVDQDHLSVVCVTGRDGGSG